MKRSGIRKGPCCTDYKKQLKVPNNRALRDVVLNAEIAGLMNQLFGALTFVFILFACTGRKELETNHIPAVVPSALSGNVLAVTHCGRCHDFVEPGALPRSSWKDDVLPSMGHRLGIYKGDHQPDSLFGHGENEKIVRQANIYPEHPTIAREDWEKIVAYYLDHAPDTIPQPKKNNQIRKNLKHFV